MANLFAFVKKYWYVVLPLPLIILYFIVRKLLTGQNVNTVTNTKTANTVSTNQIIPFEHRNNPFNIRPSASKWQGAIGISSSPKSGQFVAFESIPMGIRAAIINLHTLYSKHGKHTIKDLIHAWSPPSDNNPTDSYVTYVSTHSKIPATQKLIFDKATINPIMIAMSHQEGSYTVTVDELNDAWETVNFKI